jgi:catechol 2,3-dioxygenase-like lactoylglutathione lyase family enzyme
LHNEPAEEDARRVAIATAFDVRRAMASILGVHHTSFTVADLGRSIEFFRDRLGLEVVARRQVREDYFAAIVGLPGAVVEATLLRVPGTAYHVELFEYLSPPRGAPVQPRPCDPGSCHLSFLVDDLPGVYKRLNAAGVAFVSPPVPITAGPNRGGYGVYCRDPNGILIELFQLPPSTDSPSTPSKP